MKKILFAIFAISFLNANTVCSTAPGGATICSDDDGYLTIVTVTRSNHG